MHTHPTRTSPVVGAITILAERWVTQDAARLNAGRAARRLNDQRREADDITRFLASHQRATSSRNGGGSRRDLGQEGQESSPTP